MFPKIGRIVILITGGLLVGLVLGEVGIRLCAPLFPPAVRVFVQEEGFAMSKGHRRLAKGYRIILQKEEIQNGPDVVMVGDSMVFGEFAGKEDLATTKMEQWTDWDVLNLGIPARGPCTYNHMLRLAISKARKKPSAVLYSVFVNDFIEPPCEGFKDEELFMWEEDWNKNLGLRFRMFREQVLQNSVLYLLAKRVLFRSSSQKEGWVHLSDGDLEFIFPPEVYWKPHLDLTDTEIKAGFEQTLKKIQAGRKFSEAKGTNFVLVLMPIKEQVYLPMFIAKGLLPPEAYHAFYDQAYDRIVAWARASGIHAVDLRVPFRKAASQREKLFWTLDGHMTPAGHELVATVLIKELAALGGGLKGVPETRRPLKNSASLVNSP